MKLLSLWCWFILILLVGCSRDSPLTVAATTPAGSEATPAAIGREATSSMTMTVRPLGTMVTRVPQATTTATPTLTPIPTSSLPTCLRRIVYVNEWNGQVDLFTVLADGSGRQQLTHDEAREQYPMWSPDGSLIAFQRSEPDSETAEIYVMAADGSDVRNVSNHAADDWTPAWSPDGTQLLFASGRDGPVMLLYVGSLDSLVWRPIANSEGAAMPAWSPVGRQIAFRKELPGNDEIFVMNLDGSGSLNVTNHYSNDFTPSWSPDGQRLVFEASRDGNNEIYGMDRNGANLQRLTENRLDDEHPQWSPDGRAILYTHHGRLYLMDTNGENERPLGGNGRVDGNFASWGPCGS
jgi:Tol biopolymer transport system component